jgi:Uma2 family endonuclease
MWTSFATLVHAFSGNIRTRLVRLPETQAFTQPGAVTRDVSVIADLEGVRILFRDLLRPSKHAEHSMGMPARSEPRKQWTLDEVRALRNRATSGTRYELVDGELLVTPAPTGVHQIAVHLLCGALYPYVRTEKVGLAAMAPRDVDLEPGRSVQPDVFVVPPDEIERFRGGDPVERLVLAAEVLSPSSARSDRVKKRALYQRNRVSEYWIVDLDARVFERWRPDDDRPQILAARVEWLPDGAAAPFTLDLAAYFAEVFGEDS